jgi:uncharacterized protein YlxW (UPF0749 family)
MLKKILTILSAVGAFFSALFFMLFKKEKEEKKTITEKYDNMSKNLDALAEGEKAEKELKKENEELQKKVNSSNTLDSFNACNELLQK